MTSRLGLNALNRSDEELLIEDGETTSAILDCTARTIVSLATPVGFPTTICYFNVSYNGSTFFPLRDDSGELYGVELSAGNAYLVNASMLRPYRFVQLELDDAVTGDTTLVVLFVAGDLLPLVRNGTTASEVHIGQVSGYNPLVPVIPVLDTNAYAIGDVMFDTTEIPLAMRINAGTGLRQTIYLIDKSDQAPALELVFLSANVPFGTPNATPSLTDANAENFMGYELVGTNEWRDYGGCRCAQLTNLGKHVQAAQGSRSIYVAAIINSVMTFPLGSIVLRSGFLG